MGKGNKKSGLEKVGKKISIPGKKGGKVSAGGIVQGLLSPGGKGKKPKGLDKKSAKT
jgi:hypothetical protein